jgi:hypothetical protein
MTDRSECSSVFSKDSRKVVGIVHTGSDGTNVTIALLRSWLAKVQEAKETPGIKVIDLPDVPENKSSPHRLWIALLGAGLCLAISAGWTVGCECWGRIDSQDPGKILALEAVGSMRSRWPFLGVSANGRRGRSGN